MSELECKSYIVTSMLLLTVPEWSVCNGPPSGFICLVSHEEIESVLSSRLPLLMCCCQAKEDSLAAMVQHILCFEG